MTGKLCFLPPTAVWLLILILFEQNTRSIIRIHQISSLNSELIRSPFFNATNVAGSILNRSMTLTSKKGDEAKSNNPPESGQETTESSTPETLTENIEKIEEKQEVSPEAAEEMEKNQETDNVPNSNTTERPRPTSRIETYDEFARYRDLNRPPDSHYPPGPVRRRSKGVQKVMSSFLKVNPFILIYFVAIH